MIPEYKYQVKDYSIITPPFKEYIVKPLIKFVPWWIPANIITIVSNICMYVALVIALYSKLAPVYNYFLAAILIFSYAVGDHIDGMQAKRTKTSSALGEFFDHYLDAFNTGILLMIIIKLYGVTNLYLITFFLSANYLAHASVFYEQYKTGWLIFEKMGSLEAVLLASLMLLASCIPPVNDFFVSTPLLNLKVIELIFLFSTLGTVITFFKTLVRAKITGLNFYVFCTTLIIVSLLCLAMFAPVKLFLIITLYSGFYIGSLMRGHLADGKERLPDFVVPSMLGIAYFVPNIKLNTIPLGLVVIIFLTGCALYIAFRTVYTLRAFWVWKNPQE
jgi:phosphatidylglycerophosphate synthase